MSHLFTVKSEDSVRYAINPFEATIDNITKLWTHFSKHNVTISDPAISNFPLFMLTLLKKNTVVLTINRGSGHIFVTDIQPGLSAQVRSFFWDRKGEGRGRLLLSCLLWVCNEFNIQRIYTRIPRYGFAALHRAWKVGLRIEGIERSALLVKDKWQDVILLSVLRDELTETALSQGHLERDVDEQNWFGLLKSDPKLMRYILRNRG